MQTELINLTPHPINLPGMTVPPSGTVARVDQSLTQVGEVNGVPLYTGTYGETDGLPPQSDDRLYIVSGMVRAANLDRTDLASPANLVRDNQGRIIGAEGLEVNNG